MSEWILILTMWRYNGGAAIEHIPFNDKASCMRAANAWLKQPQDLHHKSALCAERPRTKP